MPNSLQSGQMFAGLLDGLLQGYMTGRDMKRQGALDEERRAGLQAEQFHRDRMFGLEQTGQATAATQHEELVALRKTAEENLQTRHAAGLQSDKEIALLRSGGRQDTPQDRRKAIPILAQKYSSLYKLPGEVTMPMAEEAFDNPTIPESYLRAKHVANYLKQFVMQDEDVLDYVRSKTVGFDEGLPNAWIQGDELNKAAGARIAPDNEFMDLDTALIRIVQGVPGSQDPNVIAGVLKELERVTETTDGGGGLEEFTLPPVPGMGTERIPVGQGLEKGGEALSKWFKGIQAAGKKTGTVRDEIMGRYREQFKRPMEGVKPFKQ
jgi:hypothetical protein